MRLCEARVSRISSRSVKNSWSESDWAFWKPEMIRGRRRGWFDEMLDAFESRESKFRTTKVASRARLRVAFWSGSWKIPSGRYRSIRSRRASMRPGKRERGMRSGSKNEPANKTSRP
jgi:hypothetical protein